MLHSPELTYVHTQTWIAHAQSNQWDGGSPQKKQKLKSEEKICLKTGTSQTTKHNSCEAIGSLTAPGYLDSIFHKMQA